MMMAQTVQMDERLLDRIAADRAQRIVEEAREKNQKAKDIDNLVTKALGVLQENGVYACFLFLFSRTQSKEQDIAAVVRVELLKLMSEDLNFEWDVPPGDPGGWDSETVLRHVSRTVCAQLDPLLMTKDLFEQTLIYARYGAKARKNEGE
jgi:hypothetical protein